MRTPTASLLALAILYACSDQTTTTSPRLAPDAGLLAAKTQVTDPTATWKFPVSDVGLSVQSDHLNISGTSSVYADGTCNVTTTIFATSASSSSGDATISMGNGGGKCARRLRFNYPDGTNELLPTFANLRQIENLTYSIPIGATVHRQLHMGTGAPNVTSRCEGLVWGYGVANDIAAGSDSVLVNRIDASTWHVTSQPDHNLAWCKATGELFPMSVDFTVVSSRALP
jgi:hypothetical protein